MCVCEVGEGGRDGGRGENLQRALPAIWRNGDFVAKDYVQTEREREGEREKERERSYCISYAAFQTFCTVTTIKEKREKSS